MFRLFSGVVWHTLKDLWRSEVEIQCNRSFLLNRTDWFQEFQKLDNSDLRTAEDKNIDKQNSRHDVSQYGGQS